MHAIILANHPGSFPPALLPHLGKAYISYVVDEVLLQTQIDQITIVVTKDSERLITKHLSASYPNIMFTFTYQVPPLDEEHLLLDGAVHTSLRLQDLIRYYQQFKTITYAEYDKKSPKTIPWTVYPKRQLRDKVHTHTYNCGTGFCVTSPSLNLAD